MYACIHFSNLQIVVALLFGCSVTKPTGYVKDVLLISYERTLCEHQGYDSVDRYVQIQCDGQSCNATCDGETSGNNHTSKFLGVKTQSKPAWKLFLLLPKRILCIELETTRLDPQKSLSSKVGHQFSIRMIIPFPFRCAVS